MRLSDRGAARLAWALWGVAVAFVLLGTVLQTAIAYAGPADIPFALAFSAVQIGAATAGAVVASRLPRNAVGWIFLALGTGLGLSFALGFYAELGIKMDTGPLPADELAACASSWLFIPVVFGLPIFLLLLFPTGHLPSRRWRPAAWAMGGVLVLAVAATAFKPDRIEPGIENPLAPAGAAGDFFVLLDSITNVLALPVMALGAFAIVARYRRSLGVERQQLKWFSYAAAAVAVGFASSIVVPGGTVADLAILLGLLALAGLPVAAGIAILRYRLYDVDVVINRTLVYGALTATLLGAYLGSVLFLQLALSPLTEESDLAIAGSTLAVAALFRPARRRIQEVVDRRFFRRRYDAARTLESFGTRLRDEVDLDSLNAELRAVVADTMQPAHVSLWLRVPAGGQR